MDDARVEGQIERGEIEVLRRFGIVARSLFGLAALTASLGPSFAQDADPFVDGRDGAKLHSASGFVCPAKIGSFERDAVGEADLGKRADFCAYSALNGVYGTIKLIRLEGPYDARSSLAPDFAEQEGTGGKQIADGIVPLSMKPVPMAIYARTYETARLQDMHYRVLFAGAQFQNWAVETTIEYADPRDTAVEDQFLHAVYAAAATEIGLK